MNLTTNKLEVRAIIDSALSVTVTRHTIEQELKHLFNGVDRVDARPLHEVEAGAMGTSDGLGADDDAERVHRKGQQRIGRYRLAVAALRAVLGDEERMQAAQEFIGAKLTLERLAEQLEARWD